MPLEIIHREHEGIEVLDLKGNLTFGPEDLDFRSELARLLTAGKIRAALNLVDLRDLDIVGLGTLLFALEKLRKAGGNLAVFNLRPSHVKLLVEARLETTFEAFETEQDAINSFFPERGVNRYDILAFVEAQQFTHPKS
jgi:anti-sigma B factor antagonist